MQLIAAALLMAFITSECSGQNWKWALRLGGDSVETGSWNNGLNYGYQERLQDWNSVVDITTDAQNNIYTVSSVLSKYLDVNGMPQTGYGKSDILLSSFTCDGALRWTKVIGSNQDSDVAIGVRCDGQGGVYVRGMNSANFAAGSTGCHFSNDTVTGSTTRNIFLAKWDFNGKFQWLRMPQPDTISPLRARQCALLDMDATPAGDTLFLYCYLTPGGYAGGQHNVSSDGAYVLKYTGNGTFAGAVALPYRLSQNGFRRSLYLSRWSYNRPLNQFVVSGIADPGAGQYLDIAGTQIQVFYGGYLVSFDASNGGLKYLMCDTVFHGIHLIRKVAVDGKGDVKEMYISVATQVQACLTAYRFPTP